jgi:hypothetical protein
MNQMNRIINLLELSRLPWYVSQKESQKSVLSLYVRNDGQTRIHLQSPQIENLCRLPTHQQLTNSLIRRGRRPTMTERRTTGISSPHPYLVPLEALFSPVCDRCH